MKYGYKSAKTVEEYNDVLHQLYDIDVDMETDERYPKCFCGNCKRKLDRLKNIYERVKLDVAKIIKQQHLYHIHLRIVWFA